MFKPMLAADADLEKLRFPLLASAKLDGVRAIVRNGIVLSRSLKPIPNKHVQSIFADKEYFDGELIVGDPTSATCYRDTVSGVMRENGEPDVHLFVFDHIKNPLERYLSRFASFKTTKGNALVTVHAQHVVTCLDALLMLEQKYVALGYEGLILRDPDAPYKYGRSTAKEGYLLKLKRFIDAEFKVVGFEERMHNGNEATVDALGRTKRSSHKENKTGRGDLGALIAEHNGATFNVGTGFTDTEREEIWQNKQKYLGQTVKVKYFAVGMKDMPRHPVFLGFRQGD